MLDTVSPIVMAIGLATMVGLVGMPHGGLDHLVGRAVFLRLVGDWWRSLFITTYLSVGAVVVAGWIFAPGLTTILFFLISAYHFGQADGRFGLVEGGAVIWIPMLFRPAEVSLLLAWVIPGGQISNVHSAIEYVEPVLYLIAVIYGLRIIIRAVYGDWWIVGRLVGFAMVFAGLPVLLSFVLFFCGWHSTHELWALAHRLQPDQPWTGLRRVILLAAPRAMGAVVVTAVAAWWFASGRDLTPVVVQAVFLGLSAVAVPHILLHLMADWLQVNPFAAVEETT